MKKKTLNPEFNETVTVAVAGPYAVAGLCVQVFDWDFASKNGTALYPRLSNGRLHR